MNTRTWFRVHSFTGVVTGLMLFVICWSGTFAVLSHEIDWLVTPDLRVDAVGERAGWEEIQTAVERAAPDATLSSMHVRPSGQAAIDVWVTEPDGAYRLLRVDPYTLEVFDGSAFGVAHFLRAFHSNLFSLRGVGDYIVFLYGLVLLTSLVSALYFYKRWWTRFFEFRRGGDRQVFWSRLHRLGGLWSIWFLAILAVTGVWYLVEGLRLDVGDRKVNYVGSEQYALHQPPPPTSDATLPPLPLDTLVARAQEVWPELQIRTIGFGWYTDHEGSIYFEGQAGSALVRDRANQIHLDERTGEVLSRTATADMPAYWVWSNMADPLHFGTFGGVVTKLIWFAFGLVLCGLILSGTYLHVRRRSRNPTAARRYRWPGTGAAVVVSLLVLLLMVPFGFDYARGYGPVVDGVQQLPSVAPGALGFILGWTVVTLAILGGWIWMLWRTAPSDATTKRTGGAARRRPPATAPQSAA